MRDTTDAGNEQHRSCRLQESKEPTSQDIAAVLGVLAVLGHQPLFLHWRWGCRGVVPALPFAGCIFPLAVPAAAGALPVSPRPPAHSSCSRCHIGGAFSTLIFPSGSDLQLLSCW